MLLVNCKRWCHTLYLLLLPMGIPYSWSLPFFASLMALCFKRDSKQYRLLSEEVTNIALVGVQGMCGPLMKIILQITLGLWSLLHATDLARARLSTDPQTPGLVILSPYLDQIAYSKVELVQLKANIEMLIAIIAIPAVILNQAAIAFPLLYYQFCKVKYISSVFFKNAFDKVWVFMEVTPVLC